MGLRVHYIKTTRNWPVYYLCDCVINGSALSLVTDNVAGVIGVHGHALICIYIYMHHAAFSLVTEVHVAHFVLWIYGYFCSSGLNLQSVWVE